MRFFAVSDLHVDYSENAEWVQRLSRFDFRQDVLILAGDLSGWQHRLAWCLEQMVQRFRQVLFVPGNHEFWLLPEAGTPTDSLGKLAVVQRLAADCGASIAPLHIGGVTIVPLLGWYDGSFGEPGDVLRASWLDFRACRWPAPLNERNLASYFTEQNPKPNRKATERVITFSHFLPRIDLMPAYIPSQHRMLYPVLGSIGLEDQLRAFEPMLHVYGHSHVNQDVTIDGVRYVNNALGYPREAGMTSRQLLCVYES